MRHTIHLPLLLAALHPVHAGAQAAGSSAPIVVVDASRFVGQIAR